MKAGCTGLIMTPLAVLEPLVYPGRTWLGACARRTQRRERVGETSSLFGRDFPVSAFVAPKNVTSPAMQRTAANISRQGPHCQQRRFTTPGSSPGCLRLMNLSNSSIQLLTHCVTRFCPEQNPGSTSPTHLKPPC